MASTRLTKNNKNKIIFKARELFDTRISKAVNSLRVDFFDEVAEKYIADNITPHTQDLVFPDNWYVQIDSIDIHFKETNRSSILLKQLNKKYKILGIKSCLAVNQLDVQEEKMDIGLLAEYFQYDDKVKKLREEQSNFINELKKILENCNTLSQFLKIWPQGEHIIEGLDFETTKRTRRKREVEIDKSTLDTLNTGLLKQTMLNS